MTNKSTNEEYNIISEFDKVINKTKWIDAEDYYEIEPFLRQAQIEIERKAYQKGYLRRGEEVKEWANKHKVFTDLPTTYQYGISYEDLINFINTKK